MSDIMDNGVKSMDPETIKSCCSTFYENDLVAMFFGENFHPGGEKLTLHMGEKLGLDETSKVLDVACGAGASSLALADRYGCHVIGIDLSEKNLEKAKKKAQDTNLSDKLEFVKSDAEKLKFEDETFDAIICECALCTFPDQKTAASEMYRVLKKGGRLGITDVIIEKELPEALSNLASQVICIAGALPADEYKALFREANFKDVQYENQNECIREIIGRADKLLFGWDLIKKRYDFDLKGILGITQEEAKDLIKTGYEELEKGTFGYGLFTGIKE
ncbi:MAG: methyltransferase domain-containing protein [Thermoplasmata archaeon]|nr:MAG: methyltransferase domain-containing protein [Thermoplasmata archaeon]